MSADLQSALVDRLSTDADICKYRCLYVGYKLSHIGQNSKSAPCYYSWYMWKFSVGLLALTLPVVVLAAGLVPCGGAGEPVCQTCHLAVQFDSVFEWLSAALGVIVILIIILGGIRLGASTGNPSAMQSVKRLIAKAVFGYMLFLAAWMLVDTLIKMMVTDPVYGVWNEIQCVAQPELQRSSRPTASGDSATTLPPAAVDSRVDAIAGTGALQTDIAAAAAAAGITNQDNVDVLRALIAVESSNCTNRTGPATAYGTAYGCGQLLVGTARELDPALAGMSDAEVAARLRDNNQYNLTLSARYFNNLLTRYNGDVDSALAHYNGGYGAMGASNDCPGQRRWQCVWDSPGCYNTGRTNCTPNTGYEETRNYVTNIRAIANRL